MKMTPRLRRIFSLKSRITSTDLLFVVVGCFVSFLLLGLLQINLENSPFYEVLPLLAWLPIGFLLLNASKRCRDIDQSPWVGVACAIIPFGIIYLLIAKETSGENQSGPNPRDRNNEEPEESQSE